MKKSTIILITLAFIVLGVVLGYLMWPKEVGNNGQLTNTNQPSVNEPIANNPEPTATTTEVEIITSDIDTSDWQTYRNEEWGFEVKYPREWYVVEYKRGEPSNDPIQALFNVSIKDNDNYLKFFISVEDIDYAKYKRGIIEYFEQYFLGKYEKDFIKKDIIINEQQTRIYDNGISRIIIPFENSSKIFEFAWNSSIRDSNAGLTDLLNAVVLSLNFTNK